MIFFYYLLGVASAVFVINTVTIETKEYYCGNKSIIKQLKEAE